MVSVGYRSFWRGLLQRFLQLELAFAFGSLWKRQYDLTDVGRPQRENQAPRRLATLLRTFTATTSGSRGPYLVDVIWPLSSCLWSACRTHISTSSWLTVRLQGTTAFSRCVMEGPGGGNIMTKILQAIRGRSCCCCCCLLIDFDSWGCWRDGVNSEAGF